MTTHHRIQRDLEQRLRETQIAISNQTYGTQTRDISEVDHCRYNDGTLWLYEVKSNLRPALVKKAHKQLRTHERIFVPLFEDEYGVKVDKVHKYIVSNFPEDKFYMRKVR